MQNFTKILAATVALMTPLAGHAQGGTILDRIAAEILSGKFGISTADIGRVQQTSGLSMYDMAPVLSASSHGNMRADKVWELRRQGLGWGQVAKRMGMHPGTFNKLRVAGAFDSAPIWDNALRSRFPVSGQDLLSARRRGASPQDTIAAILIGRSTNRNMESVFNEHDYDRDRDWKAMCSKHKVDLNQWKKSAKHHEPEKHSSSAKKYDKDKDKGHGQGHGKGKGKWMGNGKGNGNGNGKGNGRG